MAKVKWTVSAFMLTTGLVVVAGLPMAGAQRPAGGENARLSPPTAEPAPARAADLAPPAADLAPPTVEAAGPVARSAQRFEHLVVERPVNATRLTSLFREKELDGWEYVGIVPMEGGQPCLVFKRPKGGARTASAAPTAASPSLTVTDGRGNMYRTPDDAGRYAPSPAYPNPRALPTTPSADATPTATIPNGASRTPDVAPAPASKPATTAPRTPPADADSNTIPARQVEPPADPTEAKLPSGFEVVPLKHARATEVSKTLRELFTTEEPADRFGRSQPFTVSADDRTNSVIFRPGRGVTSRDVKAMIEKLDAESSKSSTRNPFSNTR